ncbi:MAG: PAS domain S-box protein [Mariprofundaceae bacterium]|nr:PAS domain S-box protein [Mariprofundaceae bacterium]
MNRQPDSPEIRIRELKEQLRILEEENALLAERTEDILLLGLISESVSGKEDPQEILETALERTSILKDIPLCVCASVHDIRMKIVSSSLTFSHENINGLTQAMEPVRDVVTQESCYLSGNECNKMKWPDCKALRDFLPDEVLAIPFTSRFIPSGVFLFACDDKEDHRIAKNNALLHQMVESVVTIADKFSLVQTLQGINATLDEKIEERTQQLKTSESRYRTLVDASKAAITTLEEGILSDCNQAALEMFGVDSVEQVIGHSPVDFSPEYQPDGTKSEEAAKRHMATVLKDGSCQFEWMHQRIDGTIFPVEVLLSHIELAERYVVQGIVTDISERKRIENVLKMFYHVVEQSADFVTIFDKDGVIEYFNPAACKGTGYTQEEAVGKVAYFARPGVRTTEPYKQLWQEIESKGTWEGKLTDRRKDGSNYPALCSAAALKNEHGLVTHYVCIQKDMTEYECLEEQFREAQKMEVLGTLVGGIAHNFNNILAGIIGNIYLAKTSTKHVPDAQRNLKTIEKLSFGAADMIKQLMAFARKSMVTMKSFAFGCLIKESCKLYKTSLQENIDFQCTISNEALQVYGDVTQLQQVLFNLLNNARDVLISRDDPVIDVSLKRFAADDTFLKRHPDFNARHFAHLSVSDNGPGIPESCIQNIFEPFFTTKEVGEGTGLGLAMVYGSVREHGGAIDVQSEEGKGTCFHVYLPLIEASETAYEPGEDKLVKKGAGQTILLADDSEALRETGKGLLEHFGYRVLLAGSGREAVDVFNDKRDNIDLVILDIIMPRMGGVRAADKIREVRSDIPVIFATGYDPDSSMEGMMPTQREIILHKPFSAQELSRVVSENLKD